jgi:hypothetical protein
MQTESIMIGFRTNIMEEIWHGHSVLFMKSGVQNTKISNKTNIKSLLQKCTVTMGPFFPLVTDIGWLVAIVWLVVTDTPNISGSKHSSNRNC